MDRHLSLHRGIAETIAWLTEGAPSAASPAAVINELCERVVASGIPVWRAALFVRTLHPEIMGRRIEWRHGAGISIGEASFEIFDSAAFRGSPVAAVYRSAKPLRLRLDGANTAAFPQLAELRAEGVTDYLAF